MNPKHNAEDRMTVVAQCPKCHAERRLTADGMLAELHSHGMLRRESKATAELVLELFKTLTDRLRCGECQHVGLVLGHDQDEDWPDDRRCEGCGATIAAERLEVFPDMRLCPSCQSRQESGEDIHQEIEYCRHCGGPLQLAPRSRGRLAGYRMVCKDCGRADSPS